MHTSARPSPLRTLAERVAALNPDVGRVGAGMLAQLVTEARRALEVEGAFNRCEETGMAPRICTECAHSGPAGGWSGVAENEPECRHELATLDRSLTTGERSYQLALIMRARNGACGPDGRLWQPKPKLDLGLEVLAQHAAPIPLALAEEIVMQATPLLHRLAVQSMQTRHALEREALAHRYDELAAIAQALGGAPITLIGVTLMHTGRESAPGGRGRLSNDVLVHAEAMAVDEPDVRAALAGLWSFGSPQGSTLFEHREARWLLSVRWMETPAVVEEIAA